MYFPDAKSSPKRYLDHCVSFRLFQSSVEQVNINMKTVVCLLLVTSCIICLTNAEASGPIPPSDVFFKWLERMAHGRYNYTTDPPKPNDPYEDDGRKHWFLR